MRAPVVAFVVGCGALVALVACKGEKLKWKDQQITAIEVGPFRFDLPPGWRDLSESADPSLARMTRPLGENAHLIVRQNDTSTDTNIALMWSDATAGAFSCEQFVAAFEGQAQGQVIDKASVVTEDYGRDSGCSFRFKDGDTAVGQMWLRLRGGQFLTLQCMHPKSGDADGDATCTRLAAALKAQ